MITALFRCLFCAINTQKKKYKMTLNEAFEIWVTRNSSRWSEKNKADIIKAHYRYIGNSVGKYRVFEIRSSQLFQATELCRVKAPRVAIRLRQRLVKIFDYCIVMEQCDRNPALPLASASLPYKESEFPFLPNEKLFVFFKDMLRNKKVFISKRVAFWVIMHTALRRSEAIKAKIKEIDFDEAIWTIPAERMKNNRDHIVPLSPTLFSILKEWIYMLPDNPDGWLFPNKSNTNYVYLSSPWALIQDAGYGGIMTIHGVRKIFSTNLNELNTFSRDAIEMQLGHKPAGVRGTYNKALYLEERRRIMLYYSHFLESYGALSEYQKLL